MRIHIGSLLILTCGAWQSVDQTLLKKWKSAAVIHYQITGVHKEREKVVFGDYEGKGDVTDTIKLEFDWDTKARKVIGEVKVIDEATQVANIKSDGTDCPPPSLNGKFERFKTVKTEVRASGQIRIDGLISFPPARVSNYPAGCSMRSIPGGEERDTLFVAAGGAEILAYTLPADPKLNRGASISADRKSYTVPGAENWIWTYTPTLVR